MQPRGLRPRRAASFLWAALVLAPGLPLVFASLLTSAIERQRVISYGDCMRKASRRDRGLRELLAQASPGCREGLRGFYCRRVAEVPAIRASPPMERFCQRAGGEGAEPEAVEFELVPALRVRIVFFILAYGYPQNIGRLILSLMPAAHHILVHVDVKRPEYLRQLQSWVRDKELRGIDVVAEHRVNRGGVSTLHAWLGGMSWLLQNAGAWDFYINLNDSDYPIASMAALQRFLWLNRGANFINVGSAYKDCDCGRYLVFECGDELYSIAPELHFPRRPELHHASGPNLVVVSRDFAAYVAAGLNSSGSPVEQIFRDLSILQQPDEKFWQTAALNSPFCRTHVRWSVHIWDRPGLAPDRASPEVAGPALKMLSPPLLSERFLPRLEEVRGRRLSVFFARKFDNNRTAGLQDAVDASVRGTAGSWRALPSEMEGWLQAVLAALLGTPPEIVGQPQAWQEDFAASSVHFGVARYGVRARLPCAPGLLSGPSGAPAAVRPPALRSCSVAASLVLEELAARPASPSLPRRRTDAAAAAALPRIGALRVGAGWGGEGLRFGGAVSAIPVEQAQDVTVVIYWTHAAILEQADMDEQQLTIEWKDPRGSAATDHAALAPNSLVSWARMPSMPAAEGEWSLEVQLGGRSLGRRRFFLCGGGCRDLSPSAASRYFRIAAE